MYALTDVFVKTSACDYQFVRQDISYYNAKSEFIIKKPLSGRGSNKRPLFIRVWIYLKLYREKNRNRMPS